MTDRCFNFKKGDKIYARPHQSLYRHLDNMCKQIPSIIQRVKIEFIMKENEKVITLAFDESALQVYLKYIFACHDFGKLSSAFQQKILHKMDSKKFEKLEKSCIPYSYHTQSSAVFTYLVLNEFIKGIKIIGDKVIYDPKNHPIDLEKLIQNRLENMDEEPYWYDKEIYLDDNLSIIKSLFVVIGSLAVLMHHNKKLNNGVENMIRDPDSTKFMTSIFKNIRENFVELDGIINYYDSIFDQYPDRVNIRNALFELLYLEKYEVEYFELRINFIEFIEDFLSSLDDNKLSEKLGMIYPLMFNFVYSALCETDEWDAKSYIDDTEDHTIVFEPNRITLIENMVDDYRINKFGKSPKHEAIDNYLSNSDLMIYLRNNLYNSINSKLESINSRDLRNQLYLIDAPTGSGKTLTLLNFGIKTRKIIQDERGYTPRIIYALPFVSIIDQVGLQILEILIKKFPVLKNDKEYNNLHSQYLSLHHHLADNKWIDIEEDDDGTSILQGHHFIDTWHSEIIVTSFVKLFNTICKSSKREVIRYHRLTSSIILIDEIQGIPAQYWGLVRDVLTTLIKVFGCTVVLASATAPRALLPSNLANPIELYTVPQKITDKLNRYNIYLDCFDFSSGKAVFRHIQFCDFAVKILHEVNKTSKNLMVVLNTTRSVYSLYSYLNGNVTNSDVDIYMLSTQIIPFHRMSLLKEIMEKLQNKERKIILICTQLIEAGVDISFDEIYRDYCPLDSLIQVAGRCNRHYESEIQGKIHLVSIIHNNAQFASQTYSNHKINLDITKNLLRGLNSEILSEKMIKTQIGKYFDEIKNRKITTKLLSDFEKGKFAKINSEFNLIDDIDDRYPIIFHIDECHGLVKRHFKKGKEKQYIPNKMRPFTLEVSKSNLKNLISKIKGNNYRRIKTRGNSIDIYIIHLNQIKDRDNIYSQYSGLVMENLLEKPKLEGIK